MGMHLVFDIKGSSSGACVDFPWQTSTDLTWAVLGEKNKEKRIALIEKDVRSWRDMTDEKFERVMDKVKTMLNDDTLEIGIT